jgi:hypothetical protein
MSDRQTVLVRTYSAGVHCGELVSHTGKEVVLANARRIWRWRGARTLHELSLHGLQAASEGWSRVSEPISQIVLTEAIEILPVTPVAARSIESCGWAQ